MIKWEFVKGAHNLLLYIGVAILGLCLYGVLNVFWTGLDAQVLARESVCEQPLNNRCQYLYTLRKPDGEQLKTAMSAYIFDASDLAIGNYLKKNKFSFGYEVNGQKKSWPFFLHYLYLLLVSVFALGLWLLPSVRVAIDRLLR